MQNLITGLETKENAENFENIYFKFYEFKEDFINQIISNTDLSQSYLNKANVLMQFHSLFNNLEKNRLNLKENIETFKNHFLISNQEKMLKINSIQNKLNNIKISVRAFNKKKKFYLENIHMKNADEFSFNFNLKLMNNKIKTKKRSSIETDNRINQFKSENKNLYNLELDLINQILQLEKKVGELAQNKNSIASNISKIREEIPFISKKIESFRYYISKILTNNEKKNFALTRKLYLIRNLNAQLCESLNCRDSVNFLNNNASIIEDRINFYSPKDKDIEKLSELYFDLRSLKFPKVQSLIKSITCYDSSIQELESNNAFQIKLISSICTKNSIETNDGVSKFFNDSLLTDMEGIHKELIFSLQEGLNEFSLKKMCLIDQNLTFLVEKLSYNQKHLLEDLERTNKNVKSKKINIKIISKQIENLVKKKNANYMTKCILREWNGLIKDKNRSITFSQKKSLNSSYQLKTELGNNSTNVKTNISENNDKILIKCENIVFFDEQKDNFQLNDYKYDDILNNSEVSVIDRDKAKNFEAKEKKDIFQNTKHAQFKKNKDLKDTSKMRFQDKGNNSDLKKEEDQDKNTIDFESILSFKTFNFDIHNDKSNNKSNKTNLNQDNSIVKTKKKREKDNKKENNQNNPFLNKNDNINSISNKKSAKDYELKNLLFDPMANPPNKTSNQEKSIFENESYSFNLKGNRKSNKNANSSKMLTSNIQTLNSNSSYNDNFKLSFKPAISEFTNNDYVLKKNIVEEQEDDLFKILQKNVKEANDVRPTIGEKKKRFYENYLI